MDGKIYSLILSKIKKFSVEFSTDKAFAQLTTLGCGGKILVTVFPDSVAKLVKCVRLFDRLKVRYCLLGKGSNVLASDDDFDGVVIVTSKMKSSKIVGKCAYAECGVSTVTLARTLMNKALTGGEFLACIPATIGGALVTNAGCYGQQMSDVVTSVKVLYGGKICTWGRKKCNFSKRSSVFAHDNNIIILSAKLKFTASNFDEVSQLIDKMRAKKSATQPLNYRSAGSVLFHDKVAVSRLLDMAGLKGFTVGGAQVSERHAGFVINIDKATSKDIYLVIQHMQRTLLKRFGIDAKLEIRLINFAEESTQVTKDSDDIFTDG